MFIRILASDNGGSCVGMTLSGIEMIAKTLPCETKLYLACQGQVDPTGSLRDVYEYDFILFTTFLSSIYCLFGIISYIKNIIY